MIGRKVQCPRQKEGTHSCDESGIHKHESARKVEDCERLASGKEGKMAKL